MPISAICPQCQAVYKVPEAVFGKQVRCKKCTRVFVAGKVPAKAAANTGQVQAKASGAGAVPAAKKPVAKKTMMANDEIVRDSRPGGAKPGAAKTGLARSVAKPTHLASQTPAETSRRPRADDDDELVEPLAAAPRSPKAPAPPPPARSSAPRPGDEDELVEAIAAAPRGPKSPAAPPPGKSPPRRSGDDDELVEAIAAAPRSGKSPPPPARMPPARPEPSSRSRRPLDDDEDDDLDRPRSRSSAKAPPSRPVDDDFDDDPDTPPQPGKKGKGMLIGIIIIVLLLGGGGAAFLFLSRGEAPRGDGLVDSREVASGLENLKERRDLEEAYTFFANFESPEKQARRKDVALALENEVRGNLGRFDFPDNLIVAYSRWASSEQIPAMVEILEMRGGVGLNSPNHRRQLMSTIANFKDAAAAQALAKMARNFGVRRDAMESLIAMGEEGKKELAKFYFERDFGLRHDARQALTRLGAKQEEFLDAALDAATDKTHHDRGAAVDFLRTYSGGKERSKEVCEKLVGVMNEKVVFLSDNAANALPNWLTPESVPLVAKTVLEAGRDRNCETLIKGLAKFKDTPGVIDAIARRIDSGHFGEPNTAISLLEGMGPAVAAKGLLQHMNTSNWGLRGNIRLALGKLGVAQEDMVAQSIRDLSAPHQDTRSAAVEYISKSPVYPKLRDDAAKGLNSLVYDGKINRDEVFNALAKWWNKDTVVLFCKVVNDPADQRMRHHSITILSKMGEPALAANIAYRLQYNEDRFHAARALRDMGRAAEPAVTPYALDKDSGVRVEAVNILNDIGSKYSIPTLLKGLSLYSSDLGYVNTVRRVGKTIEAR